jgi:hypothetical protein
VVIALLIVATIGLLMVALWIVIPIGQATDKRAKAQTAADAAALGGAQQARDELIAAMLTGYPVPGPTESDPDPFGPMLCGVGATQAASYAEANDAQVTSCCFASALHQAQVRVRGNWASKNGSRAQAAADAGLGRDIEPRHWGPTPLPPAIGHRPWSQAAAGMRNSPCVVHPRRHHRTVAPGHRDRPGGLRRGPAQTTPGQLTLPAHTQPVRTGFVRCGADGGRLG